jgi:hypothetical protein
MGREMLPILAEFASFCPTSVCCKITVEELILLLILDALKFINLIEFWQHERFCFVDLTFSWQ